MLTLKALALTPERVYTLLVVGTNNFERRMIVNVSLGQAF